MIEQWRKERKQVRKEIAALSAHIENSPNQNRYSGGRAKLRILLNALCVQSQKLTEKIVKYEQEEELAELFKNISGLSEEETQKLMKQMEVLANVKLG